MKQLFKTFASLILTLAIFLLPLKVALSSNWSSPVNISNTPTVSDRPAMVVDASETVHAVWCDGYPEGDILYAYKPRNGNWSAFVNVSQNSGQCQNSTLSLSSDGILHLAWEDTAPGSFHIFYASKPLTGGWTVPIDVSGGGGNHSYEPGLGVTSDGTIHLTWWVAGAGQFLPYYAFKSPGSGWSTPQLIYSGVTGRGSDLAIDASDTLHFFWQVQDHNVTDTNIYHFTKSPGGNWSTPELVSDCVGTGTSSSFCAGGFAAANGSTLHAIWHKFAPPDFIPDIYYSQKVGSGPWSQPVNISNTPGSSFIHNINGLAVDSFGNPHVVWYDDSYVTTPEVYYASFNGTSWDTPINFSESSISPSVFPAVVARQYVHVAWDEGDPNEIYYRTNAPQNQTPTANAGGPYSVAEGGSVALNGSGSDLDLDPLTYAWDLDYSGSFETLGQNVTFSAARRDGPSSQTVVLQVCDNKGACATASTTVNITNVVPTVGAITAPIDPVQINTAINTHAIFTDLGVLDTHTAVWNWGDGTNSAGTVTEVNGSGSVTGNHTYTAAGVYTLTLTVTDKDGGSGQSTFQYVVVFDSTAGFVTGAGMIDSPAGAYPQDTTLAGRANFGFSVKYLPGDTAPNGESKFKFRLASINFSSTSYQWLVISGTKATFKGAGTNNGSGNYTFLVSTIDGAPDKYRIKITDNVTNTIFYDNEMGSPETADPTTTLVAGSVVIH